MTERAFNESKCAVDAIDSRLRPLADDPDFLASLSDLDNGLGAADGSRTPASREPVSSARQPAPTPRAAAPRPTARTTANEPVRASLPQLPPIVRVPGQRPVLDLFSKEPEQPAARRPEGSGSTWLASAPADGVHAAPRDPDLVTASETFYGLRERPFTLSTDPKFLYQGAEYDRVAQQMLAGVRKHEPLVLLTGDLGVGKTTLCRAVVEQLDRHTLTSVITSPFASLDDLIKTLLVDFGVVSREEVARGRLRNANPSELAAALREFLVTLGALQAFAVVIIDEAQGLETSVLHDLRRLAGGERLMQIVLVGQPSLAAKVGRGELAGQVSLRLVLGPLGEDEISGYIMHRLRTAGDHPRVEFDEGALERIMAFTGGKPRLVNLLCDRALAGGVRRSTGVIDRTLIDGAAADLDMAPFVSKRSALNRLAKVALLLLLTLAGVAAGAVTFKDDLRAIVSQWEHGGSPSAPAQPSLRQ